MLAATTPPRRPMTRIAATLKHAACAPAKSRPVAYRVSSSRTRPTGRDRYRSALPSARSDGIRSAVEISARMIDAHASQMLTPSVRNNSL